MGQWPTPWEMTFQLKTEGFETVEDAVAYLKSAVAPELQRLAGQEDEKTRIIANRDEILRELKATKAKAAEYEGTVKTLEVKASDLEGKLKGAPKEEELETRYRSLYEQDKQTFQQQLDALKAEREQERKQAQAAQLRANAIAELGKPQHRLHNPEHFYKLHGDKITRDPETGELFIDLGEYKRQSIDQYVQDVESRPEELHLFKPKGGSGSGSPTGVSGGGAPVGENPFKTNNLTAQGKLFKENPTMYARLKAEAGK